MKILFSSQRVTIYIVAYYFTKSSKTDFRHQDSSLLNTSACICQKKKYKDRKPRILPFTSTSLLPPSKKSIQYHPTHTPYSNFLFCPFFVLDSCFYLQTIQQGHAMNWSIQNNLPQLLSIYHFFLFFRILTPLSKESSPVVLHNTPYSRGVSFLMVRFRSKTFSKSTTGDLLGTSCYITPGST